MNSTMVTLQKTYTSNTRYGIRDDITCLFVLTPVSAKCRCSISRTVRYTLLVLVV